MKNNLRINRNGGTLIEVMISALIVGALCVPAIHMFTYVASSYSRQSQRDRAFMLSQDLMSEIEATAFEDENNSLRVFGLESDETTNDRSTFDDLDDYHGYDEKSLTFRNGDEIKSSEGFSRKVAIHPIEIVDGKAERNVNAQDLRLIIVRTTAPNNTTVNLHLIRSRSDGESKAWLAGQQQKHHVRIGVQTTDTWQWSSLNALNGLPEGNE